MGFRPWRGIFLLSGHSGSSTSTRKTADSRRSGGRRGVLQISTREAADVLPLVSALGSTFDLRMRAARHPAGTAVTGTADKGDNDRPLGTARPVLGLRKHEISENVSTRAR